LEIEWIWYCHIIRPKYYHRYCEHTFGYLLDHSIDDWFSGYQDPNLLLKTARCYEKEYSLIYIESQPPNLEKTKIDYLEIADIFNDWTWYDRIILCENYPKKEENGIESEFMAEGLQGYIEFLKSVKRKGFVQGPPVNIDLFWHSHQLFLVSVSGDFGRSGLKLHHC